MCACVTRFCMLIGDANMACGCRPCTWLTDEGGQAVVRSVLARLSPVDQNASIRSQARAMMAQVPEMD